MIGLFRSDWNDLKPAMPVGDPMVIEIQFVSREGGVEHSLGRDPSMRLQPERTRAAAPDPKNRQCLITP